MDVKIEMHKYGLPHDRNIFELSVFSIAHCVGAENGQLMMWVSTPVDDLYAEMDAYTQKRAYVRVNTGQVYDGNGRYVDSVQYKTGDVQHVFEEIIEGEDR